MCCLSVYPPQQKAGLCHSPVNLCVGTEVRDRAGHHHCCPNKTVRLLQDLGTHGVGSPQNAGQAAGRLTYILLHPLSEQPVSYEKVWGFRVKTCLPDEYKRQKQHSSFHHEAPIQTKRASLLGHKKKSQPVKPTSKSLQTPRWENHDKFYISP